MRGRYVRRRRSSRTRPSHQSSDESRAGLCMKTLARLWARPRPRTCGWAASGGRCLLLCEEAAVWPEWCSSSRPAPCLVREVFQGSAQSQRLALHGKVSCAQARRTYQRFLRDEYSGACGSGRICDIKQPGGWQCSFLSAVESQTDHGLQAGCRRAGASFGVYNVDAKPSQATRAPRAI